MMNLKNMKIGCDELLEQLFEIKEMVAKLKEDVDYLEREARR
jgi:hypothetical protein